MRLPKRVPARAVDVRYCLLLPWLGPGGYVDTARAHGAGGREYALVTSMWEEMNADGVLELPACVGVTYNDDLI